MATGSREIDGIASLIASTTSPRHREVVVDAFFQAIEVARIGKSLP